MIKKYFLFIFFVLTVKTIYAAAPVIDSISPVSGYNDDFTNITINGQNFDSARRVLISSHDSHFEGTFNTPGFARSAFVDGNYAYIADDVSGLQIIDISNPSNPGLQGNINTPGDAYGVYVNGNYAYIADGYPGLQIIDISNPAFPNLKSTYNTPGQVFGVYVNGNYAFVADYDCGLQIIDISDPLNPSFKGSIDTPGYAEGVYVTGDYAYIADSNYGLQIIDISNPSNPVLKGTYNTLGLTHGVYINGNYAYLADDFTGLQIIDISNPASPMFKSIYNTKGDAYGVYVKGNYAYVAEYYDGLQIIDISDPGNPVLKAEHDTPGYALGVYVNENYAYVADYTYGLQIFDIGITPALKGTYNTPGSALGVYVKGNYSYVADYEAGLKIIDISNPANPILKGTYNTPGYARGVYVDGIYAYIADDTYGLQIIDISDPANPVLKGTYNTPGIAMGVYVDGSYAYVADNNFGLEIIDISDPASPNLKINLFLIGGWAYGIYINGNYAYVADWDYGLRIIDISNPSSPILKGTYNTPGYARGVYVDGNYAYVADEYCGLQIIDISNPASPMFKAAYNTPGYAYGVYVNGNYAYVADYSNGLQIINISNPSNPSLTGIYNTQGNAYGVYVNGNYVYIADSLSGLQIIHKISIGSECSNLIYNDSTAITVDILTRLSPGIYDITVINSNGDQGSLHNCFKVLEGITVNNAPVIDHTGDKTVNEYETLNFTISGSDPDSDVIFYEASNLPFKANYNANTQTFRWTPNYLQQGTYDVIFGIYDGELDGYETIKITVTDIDNPPTVNLIADEITGLSPLTIHFTANAYDSNGTIVNYEWDMDGNGSYETSTTGNTFTYIFNNQGTYNVKVKVTDNFGLNAIDNEEIIVTNIPPAVTLNAIETTGVSPLAVNFAANAYDSNGTIIKYEWDLDGNGNYEKNTNYNTTSYIYNTMGLYNAKVRVTDNDSATAISTKTIIVTNIPPAVTLTASETTGVSPLVVNFTANAYDSNGTITKYEWDLDGNGSYETSTIGNTRSYTYDTAGTYNAKVRVTDNDNSMSVSTKTITANNLLLNVPPTVTLTAGETTGVSPLTVNFTANAYDSNGTITKYEWDLDGNGIYENSTSYNTTSYTYNTSGIFNTKVRVTDNDSATAISTKTITVNNPTPNISPTVNITADKVSGDVPLTVNFSANAYDTDGTITKYEWDLNGDGIFEETTAGNTRSYTYNLQGNYNAKVKVTDNGGATAESVITITVNKVITNLPGNIDTASPGSAGRVDGNDLYILSKAFGSRPGASNWNMSADLDGNDIVDGNDLVILAGNFGKKN